MKGISFNVTVSDEQIEQIANLTADKVKYSNSHLKGNEVWLQHEIDRLRKQVEIRDKMIVQKEILLDRQLKTTQHWREKVKKYEELYGELQ